MLSQKLLAAGAAFALSLVICSPALADKQTATVPPADPATCHAIAGDLVDLDTAATETFTNGDAAEALAKSFKDSDGDTLSNATNATSNGIQKLMQAIHLIDSRFPVGSDLGLQLLHMKIGVAMDPVKPYGKIQLSRLFAALDCPIGDGACTGKVLLPLYFAVKEDGSQIRPYQDFRDQVTSQIAALKDFLSKSVCKDSPSN